MALNMHSHPTREEIIDQSKIEKPFKVNAKPCNSMSHMKGFRWLHPSIPSADLPGIYPVAPPISLSL